MKDNITSKKELVSDVRLHERDTGSSEVQIVRITERIQILNKHFESNAKDYSSHRGLNKLLALRRTLLAYLRRTKPAAYSELVKRLGLRK